MSHSRSTPSLSVCPFSFIFSSARALRTQGLTLLFVCGLLLGGASSLQAQVTIADDETELPDYSDYYDAVAAMEAGDLETALAQFRHTAENGLHLAQYNLGVMYYTGQGVEQSYQKAYEWLTKSAQQGHLNSMFNLATMYYNSQGMNSALMQVWPLSLISQRQNLQRAARWYHEAAEYEHAAAQYNLATMYEAGEGVDQDLAQAYMWARLARDNEARDAVELVNRLEAAMSPAQLDRAQGLYAQWVLEFRS